MKALLFATLVMGSFTVFASEPVKCYEQFHVLKQLPEYGVSLCAGSTDSVATIECFKKIEKSDGTNDAIQVCRGDSAKIPQRLECLKSAKKSKNLPADGAALLCTGDQVIGNL